jgi:hypothetical protein
MKIIEIDIEIIFYIETSLWNIDGLQFLRQTKMPIFQCHSTPFVTEIQDVEISSWQMPLLSILNATASNNELAASITV